jgi:hypothetical protein
MLTIIQSESNTWTVVAADGELHIYSREQPGKWSELSVSDDSEEAEQDKSMILEELYVQRVGQDEDGEEQEEPEAEEEEPEAEEEEPEAEEEEPELEEDEEPEEDENEEPEEETEKPRGRPRTTAKRGRTARRK